MIISLVTQVIRQLVDQPDVVTVVETTREDKAVLEIKVASSDLGRVIGREGQTIKAVRELVRAVVPSFEKNVLVSALD
jgi:predicted RNA-binding protein YlqC (UPF0109 family)